ncbi:hypothetical protein JHK86_037319 [Glycine max]|nr:hypothetical protein JHK86_037319 [Glycine max]
MRLGPPRKEKWSAWFETREPSLPRSATFKPNTVAFQKALEPRQQLVNAFFACLEFKSCLFDGPLEDHGPTDAPAAVAGGTGRELLIDKKEKGRELIECLVPKFLMLALYVCVGLARNLRLLWNQITHDLTLRLQSHLIMLKSHAEFDQIKKITCWV